MGTSREQMDGSRHWQGAGKPAYRTLPIEQIAAERTGGTAQCVDLLTRAIERQVIPRLVLAGRVAPAPAASPVAPVRPALLGPVDVVEYTDLLLQHDPAAALLYMDAVRQRELNPETLYLDFLAPSARRLGLLWDQDLCDFTQVTVGLMRLQQVLRRLSPEFQNANTRRELGRRELGRRALLVPGPGEQHTFGLVMVAEFFRRAGWDVWGGPQGRDNDPVSMVSSLSFAVVGFSVGSHTTLDRLAGMIRKVRRTSRNPAVGVMVGGPIFLENPALAALVGADTTAMDGRHAVQQAHGLLSLQIGAD
jgi:MerR family transcriptional regulator, light-induced transcriptional regulator